MVNVNICVPMKVILPSWPHMKLILQLHCGFYWFDYVSCKRKDPLGAHCILAQKLKAQFVSV